MSFTISAEISLASLLSFGSAFINLRELPATVKHVALNTVHGVAIDRVRKYPDIYILYEVSDESPKFFWFKLPHKPEEIIEKIAKALEKLDT